MHCCTVDFALEHNQMGLYTAAWRGPFNGPKAPSPIPKEQSQIIISTPPIFSAQYTQGTIILLATHPMAK